MLFRADSFTDLLSRLDMINEIERHEVVDSHTWRLVLKHPYYPTLIELGLLRPFRFISPSCFIDGQTRNGVRGLVGTGPWVLKEHKENQYALFTANPSYWGEKPRLQAVRWNSQVMRNMEQQAAQTKQVLEEIETVTQENSALRSALIQLQQTQLGSTGSQQPLNGPAAGANI